MRSLRRGVLESSNDPREGGTATNSQLPAVSQPKVQSVSDLVSDGASPCAVDIVGLEDENGGGGEDDGSSGSSGSEGGGGGGESGGGSIYSLVKKDD